MRVGRRLFPYPVLTNTSVNQSFKSTKFEFNCDIVLNDEYLFLNDASYETNNEMLIDLIESKKAKVSIVVECSETIYKRIFDLEKGGNSIKIDVGNLRGKVEVSCIAYAVREISDLKDRDFLDDYGDLSFSIDVFDILAFDDGYSTMVNFDDVEDNKVGSIFSIIRDEAIDDERMIVEEGYRKIAIKLPKVQFDIYTNLKLNDNFTNLFFSLFIVPALSNVLTRLIAEKRKISECQEEFAWFNTICTQYKNIRDIDLSDEEFESSNGVELAQMLVNFPITKAISDIVRVTMGNEGESDYE